MIVDYLLEEVRRRDLAAGAKMPSVRELCDRFACTKGTAVRAYYELKERGQVYAVPGSGYYLISDPPHKDGDSSIVDLAGTSLDPGSLPASEFQPCVQQALKKYRSGLFGYSDPQGLEPLLKALQRHLSDHQVFSGPEQIFATTGAQQALNILTRMPFPNGRTNIVLEQPTYQGMLQCSRLDNVTAIGVSRGFGGLDFDGLEQSLRSDNIKFFYTIPRLNNPLGLSYTNQEKKQILSLAERYNAYVVEDDYLGDLETEAKSTPIFSFDQSDRVVYIKTFSKVLLPGLRVAAVVLPKLLTNAFRRYKNWSDINTPLLSQGALEIYLSSGLFNVHVGKIRDIYAKRMACLRSLTSRVQSPSVRWHIPDRGAFYAGLEITNRTRGKAVCTELLNRSILVSSIEDYYLPEFFLDNTIRLSVVNCSCSDIEAAIPVIASVIGAGAGYPNRVQL